MVFNLYSNVTLVGEWMMTVCWVIYMKVAETIEKAQTPEPKTDQAQDWKIVLAR